MNQCNCLEHREIVDTLQSQLTDFQARYQSALDNYAGSEIDRKYFEHELVPELRAKLAEANKRIESITNKWASVCDESNRLESQLADAINSLQDIAHDQHLIGLTNEMALFMFKTANDCLARLEKK